MKFWRYCAYGVVTWLSATAAVSQVPALIHYQGRILVSDTAYDGAGHFKLAFVDRNGSALLWGNSPDADHDRQPDSAIVLPVTRGIYSVVLGDTNIANMLPLSPQVFTTPELYLRVWFSDGVNGFERLVPDQRTTAVGYALMAATVADGSVDLSKLAAGTLAASNLSGTLTAAQIPGLDASKITGGVLNANVIPDLNASKISSGTIDPQRIPGLDAAKVVSGVFPPSRLPSSIAYKETDLAAATNALVFQLANYNAQLTAQISTLFEQVQTLSDRLNLLSAGNDPAILAGLTAVSQFADDSRLVSNGFRRFTNLAPPPWFNGSSAGMPAPRDGHSAVWTGDEWIVWGGDMGGGVSSGSGGIYSPELDRWRGVTPVDAPEARHAHTAVWNGEEMIVWGGFSPTRGFLGNGGRLRLSNTAWVPLATAGAPAARIGHIAAWTGSRMIIWGGRTSAGVADNGAVYDPELDRWTSLTAQGAPSARSGATVVLASDRLLVWGGEGTSGPLGDGGQLILDANGAPVEWRPINRSGAPSPRAGHTAVWTGTRMIIWGGFSGNSPLGDGAVYDPVSDSWQPISLIDAPVARSGHAALWIGQEMVILGGTGIQGSLSSGLAYDPQKDLWRALSTSGQPQARSGSTAAWTGTVILLYGGRAGGRLLDSLQILDPQPTWHFYRKE